MLLLMELQMVIILLQVLLHIFLITQLFTLVIAQEETYTLMLAITLEDLLDWFLDLVLLLSQIARIILQFTVTH